MIRAGMQPVVRIERNRHRMGRVSAVCPNLLQEPAAPVVDCRLPVVGGGSQDPARRIDRQIRPAANAPQRVKVVLGDPPVTKGAEQGSAKVEHVEHAVVVPQRDDAAIRTDCEGCGCAELPRMLDRSCEGAVGVEDLQPAAVVVDNQYLAARSDIHIRRVQERARPLARPAELERGRAVGVEYVHVAGPGLGHDDPVVAVDGDAAVAEMVAPLRSHVERTERELHARRRPARGVVEPADHVDQGHFAIGVLAAAENGRACTKR